MVLQRLATGSIRITQNALKSLSPGGAAFADLRPPMPQELGMATAQLFAMVPKSKSLYLYLIMISMFHSNLEMILTSLLSRNIE